MGHILIVDDNDMNRDLLARHLQRLKHTSEQAVDGVQALELMRSRPYDVILLDLMMPRLDGFEVLQAMKDDPSQHDIPVIILSAESDLETVNRCIELGADDYLFKPFNMSLLRNRIESCLNQRDAVRVAAEHLQEPINHAMKLVDQMMSRAAGPLNETQNEIMGLIQSRLVQMLKTIKPD